MDNIDVSTPRNLQIKVKRGEASYELGVHQVNVANLKRMFKIRVILSLTQAKTISGKG